ncbi:helicase-like transcription factor CHR28 [Cucurbita moschata]|uniref:Helicase-like transcription factor CHR28 n=1 Tax=Cucurbita moschata TaxID=3662 RepID=A0A6J1EIJ2_CUCMO|nr:helicase-like transcription factor CHR28 [Cucurbita moschata]
MIMLMADEGSNFPLQYGADDFGGDTSIDYEALFHMLNEDLDPSQNPPEDLSPNNVSTGQPRFDASNQENSQQKNDMSHGFTEDIDVTLRNHGSLDEKGTEILRSSENNSSASVELPSFDVEHTSKEVIPNESSMNQSFDFVTDLTDPYSDMPHWMSIVEQPFLDSSQYFFPSDFDSQVVSGNGGMTINMMHEGDFPSNSLCSSNTMNLYAQGAADHKSVSRESVSKDLIILDAYSNVKGWTQNCESGNFVSSLDGNCSFHADEVHINQAALGLPMSTELNSSCKELVNQLKDETMDSLVESSSGPWQSIKEENMFLPSERTFHSEDTVCGTSSRPSSDCRYQNLYITDQYSPNGHSSNLSNQPLVLIKDVGDRKLTICKGHIDRPQVSPESTHSNLIDKAHVEDDPDICIIEDMSHPAPSNRSLMVGNSFVASQGCSIVSGSSTYVGLGSMRHKAKDMDILKVALQDLSQPKSESSPPDGALEVPLLRHQRIALSWMVQKETSSMPCAGGILADDQGLGKTISTIALILTERPPPIIACPNVRHELETLNLDEDDDILSEHDRPKQEFSHQVSPSKNATICKNTSVQAKGRPAAGTLVVCPTSVLRQWADELHNKVSRKANLSVLVYHGSNRTKDPCELAKYDVVLTTYSIVSMEVPKQSAVDEEDDEKHNTEDQVILSMQFPSSKKRKNFSGSDKKHSKNKKGMDNETFESVARPLAKVRWFRVVLDEAQSIKNHKTQVARACWGLRAKRRWCLSGTPIQNAIDDLYSYFRFLKYDPYAAYKSFCLSIKVPINKNPSKGYKKLQAILKTIMLRRTKGTLLDGQPIVTLPPKQVELKKVDFTEEERDFYSKLEADSRAQYEEYAAAGTVKQNYVNILLMLLRLRQACDHPLLVKPYDSKSLWRSSVDVAKKLPRDKQIYLLSCLEASLAICGICNDPPEDAVVSECGHVFCKQCILEHLSGDDTQCPTAGCKVRLSASSLFSKSSFSISQSDQLGENNSVVGSGSTFGDSVEPSSSDTYESSKIKAALEVLMSLAKPKESSSRNSPVQLAPDVASEKSTDAPSTEMHPEIPECQDSATNKSSCEPIKMSGEKAIVFSQWTGMLDLLEACLKNSSIQYRRLDGTMSVLARDKAVKDFNNLPEVSVMIMSLKAASLGLNMIVACHVLLLDLWWNPTTEDQAIDRAHRIGQTRTVKVLRLTVRDTVEDRILALQQKKREMVSSAFGEDEAGGRQTRLTVEDLNYLFMM